MRTAKPIKRYHEFCESTEAERKILLDNLAGGALLVFVGYLSYLFWINV